jgi:predicted nuclease of restriction endonuclease-like RecB superfamily
MAENLIAIYQCHQGKSRQELEHSLDQVVEASNELFLLRGFNKLLEDRCIFDVVSAADPAQVRQTVFELASRAHRESRFVRTTVLEEASRHLSIPVNHIEAILFADLKQNQILQEFKLISPRHLLEIYNTALAQTILLKAMLLKVEIHGESQLRYRQLFRAIKFCRLLYQIYGNSEEGFSIVLDGPLSLFQGCQKYGFHMALFLPALLLCHGWQLEAELTWGKNNRPRQFHLEAGVGLVSHYPDTGMYMPPEMAAFSDRFRSLVAEWDISSDCDIVSLAAQEICIPDYAFTHRASGHKVYLEIFGFWRKAALDKRLAMLNGSRLPLLLAVSDKLSGDREMALSDHAQVCFFHEVLHPHEIEKRLDAMLEKDNGSTV